VAERRARRVRVVMNRAAIGAIVLGIAPCFLWFISVEPDDSEGQAHRVLFLAKTGAVTAALLATALAMVVLRMRALAGRLTSAASTPLPPPAADPLATYREGLAVECPRHPFEG
jgi:hypothetical protein